MDTSNDAPHVRLVTISATFGAGGSVVAPLLAERLGLPFADRLLAISGPGPDRTYEEISERALDQPVRGGLLEGLGLITGDWGVPPIAGTDERPGQVQAQVEASLRSLLETTGGVVLGRAAAVPLAGHPRVFHVRLDGPVDRRARRGALWEGIDIETARAQLHETDAARARYVKRLYRRDPADPSLYHLILDPTAMGADPVVDVIASAAAAFWGFDEDQLAPAMARARARLAAQRTRPSQP